MKKTASAPRTEMRLAPTAASVGGLSGKKMTASNASAAEAMEVVAHTAGIGTEHGVPTSSALQQQPNNNNVSVISFIESDGDDDSGDLDATVTSLPRSVSDALNNTNASTSASYLAATNNSIARLRRSKSSLAADAAVLEKRQKKFDARQGITEAIYGRAISTTDAHGRARTVVRPSQVARLTHSWVMSTMAGVNHEAQGLVEHLQQQNAMIEAEKRRREAEKAKAERQQASLELLSPIRRAADADRDAFNSSQRAEEKRKQEAHTRARSQVVLDGIEATEEGDAERGAGLDAFAGESGREVQQRYYLQHGRLPPMRVGQTRLSLLLSTRLQMFKKDKDAQQ